MFLQVRLEVDSIVFGRLIFSWERGEALRTADLEHERYRTVDLLGLQIGIRWRSVTMVHIRSGRSKPVIARRLSSAPMLAPAASIEN